MTIELARDLPDIRQIRRLKNFPFWSQFCALLISSEEDKTFAMNSYYSCIMFSAKQWKIQAKFSVLHFKLDKFFYGQKRRGKHVIDKKKTAAKVERKFSFSIFLYSVRKICFYPSGNIPYSQQTHTSEWTKESIIGGMMSNFIHQWMKTLNYECREILLFFIVWR